MDGPRDKMMAILNNSGLAEKLTSLQKTLIVAASKAVLGVSVEDEPPGEDRLTALKRSDRFLLNSVGPAAAGSAIEFAVSRCQNTTLARIAPKLNCNPVNNVNIIQNDAAGPEYDTWSNTLRQFLLPRYAYLDFDTMVDPRHMIDMECGYPKFITPVMYRYMYDRDDTARRVTDIYPDETWAVNPNVYETEDEDDWTDFELSWQDLCDNHQLLQLLYRAHKESGVGHYGLLLMGLDDGKDLNEPVDEPDLLSGRPGSVAKKRRELLYLRPFDEYLSFVQQYETNTNSPRYGLPICYNLVFVDMTIDAAGAAIGTRINRQVHWTRVVHIPNNLQGSRVFGTPWQQPVFNRLLDLRKVKSGSAEMFWKGAFPGISFEIDPRFVADNPEYDEEKFRQKIAEYEEGLSRYLKLVGVSAKTLSPNICENPDKFVMVQMQAIASHYGIPLRVFLGSEQSRVASSQDKLTWNQRLGRYIRMHVDPNVVRNTINHLIAVGVMAPTKLKNGKRVRYFTDWNDLNTVTDEDKANLSLKWTQALSQYVASGTIHLIPPLEYLTLILGMRPADAKRIIAKVKQQGGWDKLTKVDPSQGSGRNGVRQNNLTKGDTKGRAGERPKKRNKADKQIEGKSS